MREFDPCTYRDVTSRAVPSLFRSLGGLRCGKTHTVPPPTYLHRWAPGVTETGPFRISGSEDGSSRVVFSLHTDGSPSSVKPPLLLGLQVEVRNEYLSSMGSQPAMTFPFEIKPSTPGGSLRVVVCTSNPTCVYRWQGDRVPGKSQVGRDPDRKENSILKWMCVPNSKGQK